MDAPGSRLRRLFLEGFTVEDIAEDLCSFDAERADLTRGRLRLSADLVDCLQLGDKARILSKRPGTAERWGMRSTREAKQVVKSLQ